MARRNRSGSGREDGTRSRLRGRRAPVVVAAIVLLVLVVLAAPFLLVRVRAVRDPLLVLAQGRLGLGSTLRLSVASVERCDPLGASLRGVTLDQRGPAPAWERVSRIGRLRARWSLAELIAGRIRVEALTVDSLEVSLPALTTYIMQQSTRPRRAPTALRRSWARLLPTVVVRSVGISHVSLTDRDGTLLAGGLQFADLASSERGFQGQLSEGRVSFPRAGLQVGLRDGQIRGEPDGAMRLSALRLECGASRAWLDASLDPGISTAPMQARVTLERLHLVDWERWIPPALPHSPGDSLAGELSVRRGPAGLEGEARLFGRLAGEAVRELHAVAYVGPDTLRLREMQLAAAAVALSAHGQFVRSRGVGSISLEWRDLDPRSAWLPWLHTLPLAPGSSGTAQAEIVLARGKPPSLDGVAEVRGLGMRGVAAERLRVRGSLTPGETVRAESLSVELRRGRVEGSGAWPLGPGAVELSARIDSLDLSELPEAWRAGAQGLVSGRIHLGGPLRDLSAEGSLSGTGLAWREWRCDRLRADSLVFRPQGLRGRVHVQLAGLRRSGEAEGMDVALQARRENGPIAADLQLMHRSLEVALSGEGDPQGWAEVRSAQVWVRRWGRISLGAPWRVRWSADSVAADTLRLASGDARLLLAGRWARRSGAVEGELRLSHLLVNRFAGWIGSADTLSGACDLRASVRGSLPDPDVSLRLDCGEVGWGPLALGIPHAEASWGDSTLRVGPVTIQGIGHRITVSEIRVTAERPLLSLIGLEPDQRRAHESTLGDLPCEGRIEIEQLELSELQGLAELLRLPATGGVPGAQSQLLVGGEAIPLRVIAPWDPDSAAVGGGLGGRFTASLTMGGTPRNPTLRVQGNLQDLHAARATVGSIAFSATYADSLIQLEQFDLAHEGQTSWARGHYPLRFSLLPFEVRPRDGEARLQAEPNDLNLALVSSFTRYVPDASGRLSGALTLEGTGRRPQLAGTVWLRDGGFRVPSRSERIYAAQAQLDLTPQGLRIRSLDARTGSRGTLTAVGTVRGPNDFDLSAHVENGRIFEPGRYDGLATADLSAYTVPDPAGGPGVPHLDGVATVLMGTITQDLAQKELVTPGPVIPWVIDLDVEAPGNVHVSQVNASADLGEGQLHLSYRWPFWNISGSIKVLGGTYRLLNNAFTIRDGSVEFRDTGAGPDLTVSADAETYVAVASEASGPAETITVQVHVQGKPDALEVSLSSQPPLSQEDIIELLSVGRLTRTGRFQAGAQTQWILLNTMVDRIENSLLQQSAIFSRVAIEPGTTGEEPLKMTLRPVVTPAFLVNYSQDLSVDPARELSVNYRLSRVLFLRAGLARDRLAAGGFNDEYSLDLKCRFEYP